MTTQIVPEKVTGKYYSPTLPVYVYSDDFSELSLASAVAAVEGAYGTTIPAEINGVPDDGDPTIQRLSHSSYRFTINYRVPNLQPLHPITGDGTSRFRFQAVAQRKEVRWAEEVSAYDASGSTTSPYGGLVNAEFSPSGTMLKVGAVIDPPAPNLFREFTLPIGSVTAGWCRTVASLVGCVNSATLTTGTYAIGTIFLYSFQGQQSSDTEFTFEIAWSYKPNVSDETRGGIANIDYNGHDFVWEKPKKVADRAKGGIFGTPQLVIVNRVHPYADLSGIGIQPP